jgi:diguanylate cyclase (GGDEF)-like protein/PAS domain S-box-containing protein
MSAAAPPPDETLRLATLRAMGALDTRAEPLFDALVRSASAAGGRRLALITLVDAGDRGFPSHTVSPGAGKAGALAAYAKAGAGALELPDARLDPRYADDPLVTGEPGVRFFAAVPIELGNGMKVGSLCMVDRAPGALDEPQREVLRQLARAAGEALELRRVTRRGNAAAGGSSTSLQQQLEWARELERKRRANEALLERAGRLAGIGGWELDLATSEITWSDQTCRMHDVPTGFHPSLEEAVSFYDVSARPVIDAALRKGVATGEGWDLQLPLTTATGRKIWVRAIGSVERADDGSVRRLVGAFQDITLQRRAIAALEASDRRYRKLFQYSPGLICTHDHEGVLLSVNPAAAKSLGYSVGEMIGRPLIDFMRPELRQRFAEYLLRIMRKDSDAGMLQVIAKDGSEHVWQYHNVLDDDVDGDDPYVLGHALDVTERFRQENQLREWSIHDPLTGCFNRRYLAELSAEDAEGWGCIVFDLDHFKHVNDTHGHARGDEVLVAMAVFLRSHVRPQDAVIRLGGDEFLVLLRGACEELTQGVVDRLDADRADAPIGFTMGATTVGPGASLEAGLGEADRRLYKAREGRPKRAT